MSDDRVETHVAIADADSPSGTRVVHFQEYWVRLHAEVPAETVVVVGLDASTPAPGVLEAIAEADLVVVPPRTPWSRWARSSGCPASARRCATTARRSWGSPPSSAAATYAAWRSSC